MAVQLLERVAIRESGETLVIDRDAGVIRNAKILGLESPNTHGIRGVTKGTRYKSCLESACKILEGAKVNIDHPPRSTPGIERQVQAGLGCIRNVRSTPTGARADLHYNRSHPFADAVLEDAERDDLGTMGFSINADAGRTRVEGGYLIVESLEKVRSVDLVSQPATTKNLRESREPNVTTFRTVLESQKQRFAALPNKTKILVRFLEADDMSAPMMDAPIGAADTDEAPSADPDEALSQGFEAAMHALASSYIAGECSKEEAMSRFKELLNGHDKLQNGGSDKDAPDAVPGDDGDSDADDSEEQKVKESLDASNRKVAALTFLLEAGVKSPKPGLVKALAALDTDAERKELLESAQVSTSRANPPRGAERGPSDRKPSKQEPPKDRAQTVDWLNGKI